MNRNHNNNHLADTGVLSNDQAKSFADENNIEVLSHNISRGEPLDSKNTTEQRLMGNSSNYFLSREFNDLILEPTERDFFENSNELEQIPLFEMYLRALDSDRINQTSQRSTSLNNREISFNATFQPQDIYNDNFTFSPNGIERFKETLKVLEQLLPVEKYPRLIEIDRINQASTHLYNSDIDFITTSHHQNNHCYNKNSRSSYTGLERFNDIFENNRYLDDIQGNNLIATMIQKNNTTSNMLSKALSILILINGLYSHRNFPNNGNRRLHNDLILYSADNVFRDIDALKKLDKNSIKDVLSTLDSFEKKQVIIFLGKIIEKETKGKGKNNVEQFCLSLNKIFKKMKQNDEYKSMCIGIALESSTSCHDRTTLGYLKMLTTEKLFTEKSSEFSLLETFEKESLIKKIDTINNFAKKKVEELKKQGPHKGEIETYLVFFDKFQKELGINFEHMIFRPMAKVSNNDIEKCGLELQKIKADDILRKMIENDTVAEKFEKQFKKIIEKHSDKLSELLDDNSIEYNEKLKSTFDIAESVIKEKVELLRQSLRKERQENRNKKESLLPDNNKTNSIFGRKPNSIDILI